MLQPQPLFDDGHQQVRTNGYLYLAAYGIVAGAIKRFNPKMLL